MRIEKLGPYRLGKKLGQGGMGSVYAAVDGETEQAVAVKILTPVLATQEGFRTRFEAEIDSLKKLRHPNIVRLFGYGEEADTLFYAMELVEGTSLEDELRAGRRFDWREVTRIAIHLCRALKHAHDHGVVHRDIKPANLLLAADGTIKLSDFGIARLFGNTRMTSDGGVLGTAEYMAPEQADGRPVTNRCDQYSLGGVMYALLAGRPPFRANSVLEMLQLQRFAEPQPVRRLAPDTPVALERVILQLLEKDPDRRFPNALILGRALEAMEKGLSIGSLAGVSADDSKLLDSGGRVDANAPTLMSAEAAGPRGPAEETPEGLAETVGDSPPPAAPEANQALPGARFVKVEEEADESRDSSPESRSWAMVQVLALAAALVGVALLGAYALRPRSADQLWHDIETLADDERPETLAGAQSQIKEFLSRFPQDPRGEQLRAYQQEIELARMERRLELASRRAGGGEKRSPLEQAYVEAVRAAANDPQFGAAKFRALVDLFGTPADALDPSLTDDERLALRLAQKQLDRLERQAREDVSAQVETLKKRLERAEELRATDPAAARRMFEALITLYGDRPWAAELIERARSELNRPAS